MDKNKKTWLDYLFCLLVGGIYLYGVNRTIISATFIRIETPELFCIGLFSILLFIVLLYNKYTIILSVFFVLGFCTVIYYTYEDVRTQYPVIYETYLMVSQQLPYRVHLGQIVVWVLSMLFAFVIVVFMLHPFNFYIFILGGAAVFVFTWLPGFTRNERAFIILLFAIILILIRKTNKSAAAAFVAAPLCVAVIFFTNSYMPKESDMYVPRDFAQSEQISGYIRDFFYELFHPVHFSFQSTGFSGAGGRLGGSITPNNRFVMTVNSPTGTYLTGAISNEYTGERWLTTLKDGDINTHGLSPSRFEMLETTAALIRGATHEDQRRTIALLNEEVAHIQDRHFHTIAALRHYPVERERTPQAYLTGENIFGDNTTIEISHNIKIISHPVNYFWYTYMPFEQLTIFQGSNRMGTIFTPPRAYNLQFTEDSYDYLPVVETNPTGTKQTPNFMAHGTGYQMNFLNVDTNFSFIKNILRRTNAGVYQEQGELSDNRLNLIENWDYGMDRSFYYMEEQLTLPDFPLDVEGLAFLIESYQPRALVRHSGAAPIFNTIPDANMFIMLLNSYSENILAEYAREVREHFLDVNTTERVRELTLEITKDYDNDFDRVTAIRDYLLQFPYTMNTSPIPRNECFVDHFLFETQEGYCTYFASAMAVMSRIAGIPSRYAEGFVLPPSLEPDDFTIITNRMAHAWTEVYLEGFGWHIIEATPTYAYLMSPQATIVDNIPFNSLDSDAWERMQNLLSDFNLPEFIRPEPTPTPVVTPSPTAPPKESEETEEQKKTFTYIIFVLIGVFAIAMYIALNLYYKNKNLRFEKLSERKKLIAYFNAITDIIAYYKSSPTPGETPLAYGKRYGKQYTFRGDSVYYRDLIMLYYKAKYSASEISAAELELMKEAYSDMTELMKKTHKPIVYAYLRYLRRVGKLD